MKTLALWMLLIHICLFGTAAAEEAALSSGDLQSQDPAIARVLLNRLNEDGDDGVRGSAASALAKTSPADKKSVAALIQHLESDVPSVQIDAARALGRTRVDVESAVAALRKGLENEHAGNLGFTTQPVAAACAEALGDLGPAAIDALPDLLGEVPKRQRMCHYVSRWSRGVTFCDWTTGRKAMEAAVKIAPTDPRTIAMLSAELKDHRHTADAARLIARIGEPASSTLGPLEKRLKEGKWLTTRQRLWLATAILRLQPDAVGVDYEKVIVEAIDDGAVESEDADAWRMIADTLDGASMQPNQVVAHVIRRHKEWRSAVDEERNRDGGAAEEMGRSPFNDVVPTGLVRIGGSDFAKAMSAFGAKARPAVEPLLEQLRGRVDRKGTIGALREITGGDHPLIVKALEDEKPLVRAGAAAVLGANDNAVPLLAKALDDPSDHVRLAAVKSLAEIFGRGVTAAKEPLEKSLKDKRKSIRVVAEGALSTEPASRPPQPTEEITPDEAKGMTLRFIEREEADNGQSWVTRSRTFVEKDRPSRWKDGDITVGPWVVDPAKQTV